MRGSFPLPRGRGTLPITETETEGAWLRVIPAWAGNTRTLTTVCGGISGLNGVIHRGWRWLSETYRFLSIGLRPQSARDMRPKVPVDNSTYPQGHSDTSSGILRWDASLTRGLTGGGLFRRVRPFEPASIRAVRYCICTRASVRRNTSRNFRIRL